MSVKVSGLTKLFGEQKAVDNISFEANIGEIVGFLGPNGAGKSTTMKIATCYIPPSSGSIKVCGFDVQEQSYEVRKNIGYLPEHNPLYHDMYVHEYLSFIGNLHSLKGAQLKTRITEMIEMCGLTLEQNKLIGTLSKGYRQRVGLAQALIHDPKVLILDEPTTGLDPNQLIEIRNLIKKVSQDKTVIFSTHIMQEVQALCSRVIVINQGQLVADNAIEGLKTRHTKLARITVEFSGDMSVDLLESLDNVTKVTLISTGKFELLADAQNDVRPAIFELASKKGIPLLGMNLEEETMEEVFHELTKSTD